MAFLLRQSVFVIIQRLDYNQGNIKLVWHLPRLWGSWLRSFVFVIDVLRFFVLPQVSYTARVKNKHNLVLKVIKFWEIKITIALLFLPVIPLLLRCFSSKNTPANVPTMWALLSALYFQFVLLLFLREISETKLFDRCFLIHDQRNDLNFLIFILLYLVVPWHVIKTSVVPSTYDHNLWPHFLCIKI